MSPLSATEADVRSSRRRHLLGFGAILALAMLLLAMIGSSFLIARDRRAIEALHVHTFEVMLVTERVRSSLNEALRGERGYLITGDEAFLPPYQESSAEAPGLVVELGSLTGDNPAQQPNVAQLTRLLPSYLNFMERTVELVRRGARSKAVALVRSGEGKRAIETLLDTLSRIEAEERRLLDERQAASTRAKFATEIAVVAMSLLALLLLLIVGWAGVAAARARLRALEVEAKLRRAATTDDLTGLLNRRAFMETLDVELERSRRNGQPMALALIDLDDFKKINDGFGHQGGDDVLRKFAEVARQTVRAADVIGRIGGEEFALLMPDTDQVESGVAAERLRAAIDRRHFVTGSGALVPVTISVGVAHRRGEEPRESMVRRADKALYDAKTGGRNRTRLAA